MRAGKHVDVPPLRYQFLGQLSQQCPRGAGGGWVDAVDDEGPPRAVGGHRGQSVEIMSRTAKAYTALTVSGYMESKRTTEQGGFAKTGDGILL